MYVNVPRDRQSWLLPKYHKIDSIITLPASVVFCKTGCSNCKRYVLIKRACAIQDWNKHQLLHRISSIRKPLIYNIKNLYLQTQILDRSLTRIHKPNFSIINLLIKFVSLNFNVSGVHKWFKISRKRLGV